MALLYKSYKVSRIYTNLDTLPVLQGSKEPIKIKIQSAQEGDYKNAYEARNGGRRDRSFYRSLSKDENNEEIKILDESKNGGAGGSNINGDHINGEDDSGTIAHIIRELGDSRHATKDNVETDNISRKRGTTENENFRVDNSIATPRNVNKSDVNGIRGRGNGSEGVTSSSNVDNVQEEKRSLNRDDGKSKNIYRVQLAALKTKQQAANYVAHVKNDCGDLLKNLVLQVEEIDLGEKGIFFRVQIGNFRTNGEAGDFCRSYLRKNRGNPTLDCLVVKY